MKKLEKNLVNLGSKPNEKKSNKKLIDEKDKLIESLQKKMKGYVIDHPHTEEIMVVQSKNEELKKEVMELKARLLQVTKEKEELASKSIVEVSPSTSKQIDTTKPYQIPCSGFIKRQGDFLINPREKVVREI